MRFAKGLIETDAVVAVDETYPKGRWYEVLCALLILRHDVLALDDFRNVLGDGGVRPCC
jgi:hypothetical protein